MLEMRPVYTSYEREEYTAPFGIVPEEDKVVICARYPERFVGLEQFRHNMTAVCEELRSVPPAEGFVQVYVPGDGEKRRKTESEVNGIEVVDEVYAYLQSDHIHFDRYDHKNRFAD